MIRTVLTALCLLLPGEVIGQSVYVYVNPGGPQPIVRPAPRYVAPVNPIAVEGDMVAELRAIRAEMAAIRGLVEQIAGQPHVAPRTDPRRAEPPATEGYTYPSRNPPPPTARGATTPPGHLPYMRRALYRPQEK